MNALVLAVALTGQFGGGIPQDQGGPPTVINGQVYYLGGQAHPSMGGRNASLPLQSAPGIVAPPFDWSTTPPWQRPRGWAGRRAAFAGRTPYSPLRVFAPQILGGYNGPGSNHRSTGNGTGR
jgi:hypothetical protein